jgi:hypothetical protein
MQEELRLFLENEFADPMEMSSERWDLVRSLALSALRTHEAADIAKPINPDMVVIGKRRCGCVVACDQNASAAALARYLALGYIVERVPREEGLRLFNLTRLPCGHEIES